MKRVRDDVEWFINKFDHKYANEPWKMAKNSLKVPHFREKAGKLKGIHGENMFKLLESRLDNIVYRMGIASTRRAARQFVNHGHVAVNGVKVDIPSFQVKPGDVVSVRENSKNIKQ